MASFIARAFGLPPAAADYFSDDRGSVHEDNINRLYEAGVTAGFPDGTYRPAATVTRAQMGSFLARAIPLAPIPGDVFTDVDGVHEANINAIAAAGITLGCNPDGTLYCPTDPVRRDQMASFLGRALGFTPVAVAPFQLGVEIVASGFDAPTFVTSPPGDSRLFVTELSGRIWIIDGGVKPAEPFLDLRSIVESGGEQGLLGLAFHPDFATNGYFYVDYTDTAGDSRLVRYQISADPKLAAPGTRLELLRVEQPATNHNGGMLAFGPDGFLYWGLGDGGGGGDPHENGQDPTTLLGSILRLDVDGPAPYGAPGNAWGSEVWAIGLRNPWRFSFDSRTGLLYIGDVGQGSWEEVDVVDPGGSAMNFGWNVLEGSHCYKPAVGCSATGAILPVVEYPHTVGVSVTGGYVHRDAGLPYLNGAYLYGDLLGKVWSFRMVDGSVMDERDWTPGLPGLGTIWSFGHDGDGRVYVVSGGGTIYRLTG
ncbi:MAG: PQQ-dependent sugar dehydrogenase [Acidimicrobiia bacterium]|nr:PQQ-dependent sugar dehydrogenase [Acidimicrobiia bacterium]